MVLGSNPIYQLLIYKLSNLSNLAITHRISPYPPIPQTTNLPFGLSSLSHPAGSSQGEPQRKAAKAGGGTELEREQRNGRGGGGGHNSGLGMGTSISRSCCARPHWEPASRMASPEPAKPDPTRPTQATSLAAALLSVITSRKA